MNIMGTSTDFVVLLIFKTASPLSLKVLGLLEARVATGDKCILPMQNIVPHIIKAGASLQEGVSPSTKGKSVIMAVNYIPNQ